MLLSGVYEKRSFILEVQFHLQVGFEKWVSDNPVEFESIEVEWEKERPVPEWLSVTLNFLMLL